MSEITGSGGDRTLENELVNVRYLVEDVEDSVDFYTTHLGWALRSSCPPAFADAVRGNLRLAIGATGDAAARRVIAGQKRACIAGRGATSGTAAGGSGYRGSPRLGTLGERLERDGRGPR
jgi:hypothetical protein